MDAVDEKRSLEQNEFERGNIRNVFYKYGFITLAGMSAQAIMVILEGVFTGRGLGALGLATVSVIMPLELVNDAIGSGLGMGVTTVAAINKGAGKIDKAQKVFSDGFWITIIFSVILAALIELFAPQVASILGATGPVHPLATEFIRIFMIGYPFAFTGQVIVAMLRVDEKPGLGTFFMTFAAIVATLELYWGIFIAKLGIAASAIYYCLSIGLFFLAIGYFIFSDTKFKIKFDFRFNWPMLKESINISLPFIFVTLSSSVYTWVMNLMLGKLGTSIDVAAFSIINGYVFYVLNMITVSFTQGMQPIASDNYGAKLHDRVSELLKASVWTNILSVGLVVLVFVIFAKPISAFFAGNNLALMEVASSAGIIVIGLTFLGSTANMLSGFYQAINRVKISNLLGVLKFLFLASPLAVIFGFMFGVKGVWFGQPVADLVAFIVAYVIYRKELKTESGDQNGEGR